MPKPIMNLDDVEFDDVEENGLYTSSRAQISDHIGARKLGYNLTVLPPGKAQCPFHSHHVEEEMFLILEGEGELRFGDERYPIRKHDVIACPTGGADVAHQIINTGTTTMRYLALSTLAETDVCEYPDSQKLLVVSGKARQARLAKDVSCRKDGRLLRSRDGRRDGLATGEPLPSRRAQGGEHKLTPRAILHPRDGVAARLAFVPLQRVRDRHVEVRDGRQTSRGGRRGRKVAPATDPLHVP